MSLEQRVQAANDRYEQKRPISAALHERARRRLPGGNTRSVLDINPFPFKVAHSEGAYLTDVDGHRYLDLLGNYTAGLLGHSSPAVKQAVINALDNGWSLGATHEAEIEFAELLCERFPSLEQVRFTNSGTEANLMAIATAKHITGRSKILIFEHGYHGGVLYFGPTGAPIAVPHEFVTAPYNDVDALQKAFDDNHFAAVLVEPMLGSGGCIPATSEFLQTLRHHCTATGTILIFDEVMTSRLSIGGAQLLYNVTPDMTTLGKYLGGGMSFGAFGGTHRCMAPYDPDSDHPVTHGGTFNNNVLTMNAGVAALRQVLTSDALTTVNERGERLRSALEAPLASVGIHTTGLGSLIGFHSEDDRLKQLFFHDMLDAGFYFAPRGFVALSLAVNDSDIDQFVQAVEQWSAAQ